MTRLERYKQRLEQYYTAEEKILGGAQSYSIGSRSLTRANLKEIRDTIQYLERQIDAESAAAQGKGRNKVVGIVPRDF